MNLITLTVIALTINMLKQSHTDHRVEAGIDEVGRGCLAGPVVAAAVILPKDYSHPLLNDSKKLTQKTRRLLETHIKQHAIAYQVAQVSHQVIDQVNILNATFLAMHQALDALTVTPDLLLVDGNRFAPYHRIEHLCVIKGDGEYLAIAAASVLAKNYRDDLMADLATRFPAYGWERNVGYPTAQHRKAIMEHGITEHHRKSFTLLPKEL